MDIQNNISIHTKWKFGPMNDRSQKINSSFGAESTLTEKRGKIAANDGMYFYW